MGEERTGQNPQYGEKSGQEPEYGDGAEHGQGAPGGGIDTGGANEDLHGTARQVDERSAEDATETPGAG
jgi:hypothetical protein